MAKKTRKKAVKKAAKKSSKKSAAKRTKKSKPARKSKLKTKPKAKAKAKPTARRKVKAATPGIGERISGAYHTVVDTVKGTGTLRDKLERPGTSETE